LTKRIACALLKLRVCVLETERLTAQDTILETSSSRALWHRVCVCVLSICTIYVAVPGRNRTLFRYVFWSYYYNTELLLGEGLIRSVQTCQLFKSLHSAYEPHP